MTENNQTQLRELTPRLEDLAQLYALHTGYASTPDDEERAGIMRETAAYLTGFPPKKDADPETRERIRSRFLSLLGDFKHGHTAFHDVVKGGIASRAGEIASDYQQNLGSIMKVALSKLDAAMEGSEDIGEAAGKIMYAITPRLLGIDKRLEELTEGDADEAEADVFRQEAKLPTYTGTIRGNLRQLRDQNYNFAVRSLIKQVKDEKTGKTQYKMDRDKIKPLFRDPALGAFLYTAEKPKEEAQYRRAA